METSTPTLSEVFERYESLKREEEALKAELSEVRREIEQAVALNGGRLVAHGWDATVTAAAQIITYDTRAVECAIAQLVKRGLLELAQELAEGRKVTNRVPHLRVARSK
jgi:hypothetical protein